MASTTRISHKYKFLSCGQNIIIFFLASLASSHSCSFDVSTARGKGCSIPVSMLYVHSNRLVLN